jgi:hypothetical protein
MPRPHTVGEYHLERHEPPGRDKPGEILFRYHTIPGLGWHTIHYRVGDAGPAPTFHEHRRSDGSSVRTNFQTGKIKGGAWTGLGGEKRQMPTITITHKLDALRGAAEALEKHGFKDLAARFREKAESLGTEFRKRRGR